MNEVSGFALSSSLGLTLVVLFGIAWIAFGWYLGRANKTHEDFALAGRNVGFALAAATAACVHIDLSRVSRRWRGRRREISISARSRTALGDRGSLPPRRAASFAP